tara:strand:- start:13715 stop:14143 length:429 start_codon:yes stop_codon:yes gene_type:complete
MGRITIHIHGQAKEKAYSSMLKNYQNRLRKVGVKLNYHDSKKSVGDYFAQLDKNTNLYLLDESGTQYNSIEFSKLVQGWSIADRDVELAIGPAQGWQEYSIGHDNLIALSKLTFPHELAAVVLVEQVYRATEIIKGTKYHKE